MAKKARKKPPAFISALYKAGHTDSSISRALGYKHPSSICRKVAGEHPWTAEDAVKLEQMSDGLVRKESVLPSIFGRVA